MVVLVGINGFGRIGRQFFRASLFNPDIKVVAINDPFMDSDFIANAIKYDSTLGRYSGDVEVKGKSTVGVDGVNVECFAQSDPMQIPWGDFGAQYVIECSSVFTTVDRASNHLAGGAQRVIVCAPSADAPTLLFGVNEASFKPSFQVVSAGSCTAVALGPALQALHDRLGGYDEVLFTAIHSATGQQRPVDGTIPKDFRLSRGSGGNIIPCATSALKTLQRVMPPPLIMGCVNGTAVRVPTQSICLLDVTVRLRNLTSKQEVDDAFRALAQERPDQYGFTVDPVCGLDFAGPGNKQSFVYDSTASLMLVAPDASLGGTTTTQSPVSPSRNANNASSSSSSILSVQKGHMFKLMFWYNNESGYAHRVMDMVLATSTVW